jgi:hypothetical protein
LDLWNDEEHDLLPLADAAHAIGRLRVVTEDEVRREGQDGIGRRRLRNIGAGRVDLIVKGEASFLGYTALLEGAMGAPSVAIRGHQRPSEAIRGNLRDSPARGPWAPHQRQSEVIRGN